jgi:uroporphyrinogen-III synthase
MTGDSLPLSGKRVLVPRGKDQAEPFSRLIRSYGGIPVEVPLLAFRPAAQTEEILHAVQGLATYDWIIFTSKTALETFLSLTGKNAAFPKVAAIGTKTERAAVECGLTVHFTPAEFAAEGFVEEFLPCVEKGMKVLIPKGNKARSYIADQLRKAGAEPQEIIIYETGFPEESGKKLAGMLESGSLDVLAFTSPSTVEHFMRIVRQSGTEKNIHGCVVSCIGPVTQKRAEELGLDVQAVPAEYTIEEMVRSIAAELNQRRK